MPLGALWARHSGESDMVTDSDFDLREQLARIDQLRAHTLQLISDSERKQQEMRFAPLLVAFAGMTAGAALFATGGAVGGLLVKFWIG
jgi:hypothetical protein